MANRLEMLGSEMSKILSEGLREIKDPNYTEMTSVLSVDVTKDLKYATVLLSVFSMSEEKRMATFEAIKRCSGFLRHYLAKEMTIRTVPSLKFVLDTSSEYSARINSILSTLDIKKEENED